MNTPTNINPTEPTPKEVETLLAIYQSADMNNAEGIALELCNRYSSSAFCWKMLGSIYSQKGRFEEAVMAMTKSALLNPKDAEAHRNVGIILMNMGRLQEAEKHFQKSVELKHDYATAYSNLGQLYWQLGKMQEAENCFREVVRINPSQADGHFNLGIYMLRNGFLEEAELSLREAIRLEPNFSAAVLNLGNVYNERQKFDEAECCYIEAMRLNPENADAYYNLGLLKAYLGNISEARKNFLHAIELNPDAAEYLRQYIRITKIKPDNPLISQVENLYYDKATSEENRINICFAVGKMYDDLGEYEKAFKGYEEGNMLRRRHVTSTINDEKAIHKWIKSMFEVNVEAHSVSSSKVKPILIVGMPRSGTSLVEQILASHSLVYGAGELNALDRIVGKNFEEEYGKSFDQRVVTIAEQYFDELSSLAQGNSYITDKMPLNYRWIGFLLSVNCDIKIVHTKRNPLATCWSIYKQNFSASKINFAYDLNEIAEYYKLYQEIIAFWHEKFPGRIYDLDYEKLTEYQEEETKKLLDYCGLPWEDACLNFYETKRAVRTASESQVRQKIYKGSSEAWKKFEKHLGPLKRGLGLE